ncbi:hypothetical protein MKX66_27825 [Bacillus sp. FSL R9-9530]|uniref:hypothetical protein n=1 Tax=Bacillus sp. FSL R9-9530 TaxID=2921593 RepID=UPI0030FB6688
MNRAYILELFDEDTDDWGIYGVFMSYEVAEMKGTELVFSKKNNYYSFLVSDYPLF